MDPITLRQIEAAEKEIFGEVSAPEFVAPEVVAEIEGGAR